MKIQNKLSKEELDLLNKININIEDIDYTWEELDEIKENIILNGEISNMDKDENPTVLSNQYSDLADKFIEIITQA